LSLFGGAVLFQRKSNAQINVFKAQSLTSKTTTKTTTKTATKYVDIMSIFAANTLQSVLLSVCKCTSLFSTTVEVPIILK